MRQQTEQPLMVGAPQQPLAKPMLTRRQKLQEQASAAAKQWREEQSALTQWQQWKKGTPKAVAQPPAKPPAQPTTATGSQGGGWGQPPKQDFTNRGEPTASRANLTANQLPTLRQKMWGKAGAEVTNGKPAAPATSSPSGSAQPLMGVA